MTQNKLDSEAYSLGEVRRIIKENRIDLIDMANHFITNMGELSIGRMSNNYALINPKKLLEVLKDE